MSREISSSEYADFLATEYFGSFIADGGSAVKVAVAPSPAESAILANRAIEAARQQGYVAVPIDAAATRVSLIQEIFFAVAAQIDWASMARRILKKTVASRLGVMIEGTPTLDAISALRGLDAHVVRGDVIQGLNQHVNRNFSLAIDFRSAMLHYCRAELDADARSEGTREIVDQWIRGELRLISAMKDMSIFQKIGRHNARVMVSSAAEWLRQAGHPGLLLVLDIDRLAVANKRDVVDGGLHYTPSHVMDTYEVLRQFIDATDEMSGVMLLVSAPIALLDDDRRGLQAYDALKARIWDDVRDRSRVNPFAPMVRIAAEAAS